MHLAGISRYPIKGFAGEDLRHVTLEQGRGVPGDRRFAFGIDSAKDDGTWYSSRNYLINSRKENLLKFAHRRDHDLWEITSPCGQVLQFDATDATSLAHINAQLGTFMQSVENNGNVPCLIDRNPDDGPKGHWDFPDAELLVVNLATLRAFEDHWGIRIDRRRFRANLWVDGLPAWSEFGHYGAEFSVGSARITFLRPARRCAALSVNPTSGDRDIPFQNDLVRDFGHGFMGVYAKITQAGYVAVGDRIASTSRPALRADMLTCDLAPDVSLWPKAGMASATQDPRMVTFVPVGSVPLAQKGAQGRMKIHVKPEVTLTAQIVEASDASLKVHVEENGSAVALRDDPQGAMLLSGPFATR